MRIDTYDFIFHPFDKGHSCGKTAASLLANIALTAITAGLYILVFVGVRTYEYCGTPKDTPTLKKTKKVGGEALKPTRGATKASLCKVDEIKKKQKTQLSQLKALAEAGEWQHLATHTRHPHSGFDWWMFPVDRSSASYKGRYAVSADDIKELKKDLQFMKSYRNGVVLVAQSWGWDLEKGISIPERSWSGYEVRLGKMLSSLRLFGQADLRENLVKLVKADCDVSKLSFWIQTELW